MDGPDSGNAVRPNFMRPQELLSYVALLTEQATNKADSQASQKVFGAADS